ncbi:MAG TPA: putative porin [Thermodesulfobacteriota bacterium]|nr:putative porin [Thermodesulfobacteriota bacterium]
MRSFEKRVKGIKDILNIWFLIAIMVATIFFVLVATTRLSHANEVEKLLDKLVEKKVLTPAEAQQVLVETREEERKKIAQQKHDILPEWIQKTKLTGDFRLREQYEKRDSIEERWRTRIRLRLGVESQVADKFKVGFGLATGGTDPRSTNQTLGDTFEGKNVNWDFAYGQYTPFKWLTLVGGKFKNPLFSPADLIWDTDINPEGGYAQFNYNVLDYLGLFANVGVFVLDERHNETKPPAKNRQDPFMYVFQPGFEWKIQDPDLKDLAKLKASVAYYGFSQVKDNVLDHSSKTNTLFNKGLKYDYDVFVTDAQLGFMPQGFIVPYLGVFGQFVYNPDPPKGNTGWLLGGMFGAEKVSEKGQWQVKYNYRRLGRDAVLDTFPDSDFFGGATDVRGHEGIFEYGIYKNISVTLDYYNTQKLHGPKHEDLFQLDWNLKF